MPGRPGQSVLAALEAEIRQLLADGASYRNVAEGLNARHGLNVSHNAVYSFVKAKSRRHRFHRSFLAGLDRDLREDLMRRLIAEWTHDSTAIEGNTLTLGETLRVIQFGLTIHGKSLKDHEEVNGHARAIDLLQQMADVPRVDRAMLFELHQAIMPRVAVDAMNPIGAWKRDFNGTTGMIEGKAVYMEYAAPDDVAFLMDRWLEPFNQLLDRAVSRGAALSAYVWSHTTLARIHPFFDGNGRLARLLANLPLLRGGFPPLMVAAEKRLEYIQVLWDYEYGLGRLERGGEFLPESPALQTIRTFFETQWQRSLDMVEAARRRQKERRR